MARTAAAASRKGLPPRLTVRARPASNGGGEGGAEAPVTIPYDPRRVFRQKGGENMTNKPSKERRTPAATGTMTEELQRLAGPLTPNTIAAVAARHVIRRLELQDTTRTWATLKALIEEAVALRVK